MLSLPIHFLSPRAPAGPFSFLPQIISFDQDGVVEGREVGVAKSPVRLLERIEELRVLSQVSEAGLLSSAEEAGLFSKLEAAGAFSKAEALLPLADDLKLLSTAEALLNVPSSYLFGIASLLLVGGACVLLQLQIGPRHEAGWETGPGCWNVNGSSHREPRAAAPVSAAHMRRRSVHVEFSTLWTRLARFCGVCMLCYYLFAYISRDLNSFVLYMHFY